MNPIKEIFDEGKKSALEIKSKVQDLGKIDEIKQEVEQVKKDLEEVKTKYKKICLVLYILSLICVLLAFLSIFNLIRG